MRISLVVAAAEDNAIGGNNDLLWKLPNDMRFFKNLTWGMPVIMGRKTFFSMSGKPLPGRFNIVVTRNPAAFSEQEGVWIASNLDQALALAASTDCKEAFVIGGGEIYSESMKVANRIYLTRVHAHFPGADVHFPEINLAVFSKTDSNSMPVDQRHAHAYTFETWERGSLS
jgi:dihydrofolate reductase